MVNTGRRQTRGRKRAARSTGSTRTPVALAGEDWGRAAQTAHVAPTSPPTSSASGPTPRGTEAKATPATTEASRPKGLTNPVGAGRRHAPTFPCARGNNKRASPSGWAGRQWIAVSRPCGGPAVGRRSSAKRGPVPAGLVKQGKLPPVTERIPKVPFVIKPVHEVGRYGGTWRRGFTGPGDQENGNRIVSSDKLLFWEYTGTPAPPLRPLLTDLPNPACILLRECQGDPCRKAVVKERGSAWSSCCCSHPGGAR